jgi:hypothetical protein
LTISAGGNDVGLSSILNDCIFGWLAKPPSTCDSTIKSTQLAIDNQLPAALDALLAAALPKLTPNTGRIYYTGYAKYFNADTTQCNSVNFAVWEDKDVQNAYKDSLSNARRKQYNDLVDNVNAKIKEAVVNAGYQAVFVDYDAYFQSWGGRYCEEGVAEPDGDADFLLFYERDTTDPPAGSTTKRADPASDPEDVVPDSSFEGQVARLIWQELEVNPSWVGDLKEQEIEPIQAGVTPLQLAPGGGAKFDVSIASSALSWFIPDKTKRVFHPQPNGHAIIANLVLYHMEVELFKQSGNIIGAEDQTYGECPLNPFRSIDYPSCHYDTVSYIPTWIKNPGDMTVFPPNYLLYKLQAVICSNSCRPPTNFEGGVVSVFQNSDKSNCEISVAMPNNVEAWAYRGTPFSGSEQQDCFNAYQNIIDQCINNGPNNGWVNGPEVYEYFVSLISTDQGDEQLTPWQQAGFRPINDPSGLHSATNPLDPKFTLIDWLPAEEGTAGWTCKDKCPGNNPSVSVETWCVKKCGCTIQNSEAVLSCPL